MTKGWSVTKGSRAVSHEARQSGISGLESGARTQIEKYFGCVSRKCKGICIRPRIMQNVLHFDNLDQNLLDSTALNAKSFALHLLRCKILWI
jgi:hypothetical protein